MKRPHFLFILLAVVLLVWAGVPQVVEVKAEPRTLVVPDDFSTIQEAVDAASEGDTVFVKRGTYTESICIDQPLSLVGEDPTTTKIVGEYQLNGTVVLIRTNNVSVTGFTVQPFSYSFSRKGVHLLHVRYCSVVGNVILNNGVGVWLYGSSENNITGNTIDGPVERSYGIWADKSPSNWIFDNMVTNNYYGISIQSDGNSVCGNTVVSNSRKGVTIRSNNNIVSGNVVTNQGSGIVLAGSNNLLRDNKVSESELSFDLAWGLQWSVSDFVNDVDPSNTFDGKPIVYWVNKQDKKVPEDAQTVVLVNCTKITVENLVLSNSREGIMLVGTTKSTVRNNFVQSMDDAILLFLSYNNTITDNTVYDSSDGVLLCSSSQNTITGNSIADGNTGIKLDKSDENTISGNVISDGNRGGISLEGSNNNKIFGNTVSDCTRRAVWIWNHASQNVFYLNNFVNNTVNVEKYITGVVDSQFPQNVWDNGTLGNYWNDYNGTDTNSNGIGDTPYIIEENNQDNYPLMEQVDISTIPEFSSLTLVAAGIFAVTVLSLTYKHIIKKGMKKIHVIVFVLLAFSLVWIVVPQIRAVKAQEALNVTIKPDGSVVPNMDRIERNGTRYMLKGDVLGSIMVQKSGITIDGAGFTISHGGITLAGPDLSHRRCSYILVTNVRFFNSSVFTVGASNNSFIGNYFDRGGIQIQGCANITGDLIKHNTFRNYTIFIDYNRYGLDVITENNFFDSQIGVGLSDAPIVEKNYWSNYNGTDTNGDGIGDTPFISHILDEPVQDDYPLMSPLDLEVIPEFPSGILLVSGLLAVSVLLIICRHAFKSVEMKKQKLSNAVG